MRLTNSIRLTILAATGLLIISFRTYQDTTYREIPVDSLRAIYSQSPDMWPAPHLDAGVKLIELGILPPSPLEAKKDSLKAMIALGKTLFFDPRLSGSNQLSCSSCHAPDLNWADGREVSVGHDHAANKRNAPSLENVWFFKKLFWDGRSNSLEDQAMSPISSPVEMHQDLNELPAELRAIPGYHLLFAAAFGDKKVTTARIMSALATYQRTITSRKTDFDYFLSGKKNKLTDQQLLGLHLFRTKARCINCHNGPLFTDGEFHNVGLTYYGREREDLGRYNITKDPADVGKFKTPGLRNVLRTRPWFHNGIFDNIEGLLNMYNAGMPQPRRKPGQEKDLLYPVKSPHLQPLQLTTAERDAVIAFLGAITTEPWKERAPVLP
ncbi:cytochrome-c peroxidase [Chitinophaga pendula]|uniref:cytochrome-c peroxidase n=1 Tax=Chitinophaga TaxID=79328 RepID=UPI000BAEFDD8|nr:MULTISPECIES: cytochrome c peroxidase [Chitinophaga]ASZ12326.1 cytochrome-c peroxidase [Chitinophaga sp. MD30]UCJ10080.1 cytochrome-c peroxidase [Chitinophaga pendula]